MSTRIRCILSVLILNGFLWIICIHLRAFTWLVFCVFLKSSRHPTFAKFFVLEGQSVWAMILYGQCNLHNTHRDLVTFPPSFYLISLFVTAIPQFSCLYEHNIRFCKWCFSWKNIVGSSYIYSVPPYTMNNFGHKKCYAHCWNVYNTVDVTGDIVLKASQYNLQGYWLFKWLCMIFVSVTSISTTKR
jgi:hypothetical protein